MPGIIECDHYYCRESLRFLFTQKHLLFLQKSCTFSSSIGTSSALFFSRHIDDFRGTEINLESPSCAVDARGAREKHDVYSGTFGTQIKARPFMTAENGGVSGLGSDGRCVPCFSGWRISLRVQAFRG
jgi:hypothetical protein